MQRRIIRNIQPINMPESHTELFAREAAMAKALEETAVFGTSALGDAINDYDSIDRIAHNAKLYPSGRKTTDKTPDIFESFVNMVAEQTANPDNVKIETSFIMPTKSKELSSAYAPEGLGGVRLWTKIGGSPISRLVVVRNNETVEEDEAGFVTAGKSTTFVSTQLPIGTLALTGINMPIETTDRGVVNGKRVLHRVDYSPVQEDRMPEIAIIDVMLGRGNHFVGMDVRAEHIQD